MSALTIPAHFDGEQIKLDSPVKLPANARLLVTVLPDEDEDREAWLQFSLANLSKAYSDDEPDYGVESLKWVNPDYAGR